MNVYFHKKNCPYAPHKCLGTDYKKINLLKKKKNRRHFFKNDIENDERELLKLP